MVVRRTLTKQLCLKNQGIGDKAALNLADSIRDTPYIHSMNLSDNRLTDDGMKPILDVLVSLPVLVELDLSQNEIGSDTSEALAQYLGRADCPLLKLVLKNADVDDFECEGFISALQANTTLKEIDLSNNKIGSAEVLNTVMPDLTTGGEAIADWLREDVCVLETLKLSWNMIRLDSAVDMCSALSTNTSLTYLDLSYNSLGHDGGLALGNAIIDNHSLKTCNVSNNNIDATACFTICVGVIENMALTRLLLNGNPIGEQGARALMLVPMTVGDRTNITANGSNILIKDSRCWFDPNNACRSYKLDLNHPFERAVAFMLMRIIATHPTYIFKDIKHVPVIDYAKQKFGKPTDLKLHQIINRDAEKFMNPSRKRMVDGLREIVRCAEDADAALEMFLAADEDGGGELDPEELMALFHSIGTTLTPTLTHHLLPIPRLSPRSPLPLTYSTAVSATAGHLHTPLLKLTHPVLPPLLISKLIQGIMVDEERVDELVSSVDIDGEGALDYNEFMMLLRRLGREAKSRLKDLTEFPVMAEDGRGDKRYIPPKEGLLTCEIVDAFKLKPIYRSMSQVDHDYALQVLHHASFFRIGQPPRTAPNPHTSPRVCA
jgi:Ran GTPase-activating protein (RanGAP) involved in mRNA processing and transport